MEEMHRVRDMGRGGASMPSPRPPASQHLSELTTLKLFKVRHLGVFVEVSFHR